MKIFLLLIWISGCYGFPSQSYFFKHKIPKKLILKATLDSQPSQIIKGLVSTGRQLGTPWTVNDITENIRQQTLDGVSLFTKDNEIQGLIAIDNNHVDTIMSQNLHPVNSGASSISNLIVDELVKNNVKLIDSREC